MSRLHGDRIGQGAFPRPVAYTPVVTWAGNTITTQSGLYIKTPGKLEVWVSFVETVGTAAAVMTITIPTGYTVATMAGSLAIHAGTVASSVLSTESVLSAASGATVSVASPATIVGAVATWFAYIALPTLT